MVDKAEWFWKIGEHEKAIWQLNIYLQSEHTTEDGTAAYRLLESYYRDIGKTNEAEVCVKAIARLNGKQAQDSSETVISAANPVDSMDRGMQSGDIMIQADCYDTESMVLRITSANLMPNTRYRGQIENREYELDTSVDAETTDWFDVSNDRECLTLSGGFNVSIWQFRSENGEIVEFFDTKKQYNDLESHYTGNAIWSTVAIPSNAVSARVTFWYGEKTSIYDNPVCINYGSYPVYCAHDLQVIELPNISLGEALVFDCNNSTWTKRTNNGIENIGLPDLRIRSGDTISLSGSMIGSITFENRLNDEKGGQYGVRWSRSSTSPIGERMGDAQYLDFGYRMGEDWIGTGDENDFDEVYPWNEIKQCIINDDGSVVYIDDSAVLSDSQDVMVEIPKFYVKREVDDDFEYIWISEKERDGYVIDPAFMKDGSIVDKIYVGAYLSGYNAENEIGSYSNVQPLVNVSLNDVRKDIALKGNNWHELDFITLSMLQKLFLVETACKDSQALFMGAVNLSWGTCYAIEGSTEKKNTIIIEDNASSKKINVGDSVVVFDVPQGTSYYSTLTKYQNNADWDRTVTGRKKLESGNIQIEFSGNPIVSIKDTTLIMHLPNRTGKTDHLESATGQKINSLSGNLSFRYRYIENLWGSVCVMLDNVIIKNGEIHIIGLGDTSEVVLSYKLAEQRGTPSEGVSPAVASIRSMGYDPNNPLLMLPDSVGNGASSVSAYCDACFYQINDKDLILTYGLTWDLRQYAGLFGYRANISTDESKVESGSRLIYK